MVPTPTFGSESTSDELLDSRDLSGTTAIVTGASAGLGVETVRSLAAHGARVVAAVRELGKARTALASAGIDDGHDVTIEEVDLASLASVRAFADRIGEGHERFDLLVANAGVMSCPEGRTVDGFEVPAPTIWATSSRSTDSSRSCSRERRVVSSASPRRATGWATSIS